MKRAMPAGRQGFTLIELLLYVAILAMMIGTMVPFALNIMTNGARSSVQQEVAANARFISEKIKYQIRQATTITTASGQSLILNNGTIGQSGDFIQLDGVNLNSNDTKISNLTFTNMTSPDAKSKNVKFSFTISSKFDQARKDYQYSMNVESAAELRTL